MITSQQHHKTIYAGRSYYDPRMRYHAFFEGVNLYFTNHALWTMMLIAEDLATNIMDEFDR